MDAAKLLTELNGFADVYKGLGADPEFQCLIQSLKEEIALGEQKKAGKADRFKGAVKFAKLAKKKSSYSRPGIAGAYIGESGKQYIMIDAMVVRYDNPYDGLVEAEEGTRPNIDKVIETYDSKLSAELPSIAELKTELKLNKAEGKLYEGVSLTKVGESLYNTEYLIQMIEAVEPSKAYFATAGQNAVVVLIGDGAQGALLPVRPKR